LRQDHDRFTTGRGGALLLAFAVLAAGVAGLTVEPRPVEAAVPAPAAAAPTVQAAAAPVGVDCSRGDNLGFETPEVTSATGAEWTTGGGAFVWESTLTGTNAGKANHRELTSAGLRPGTTGDQILAFPANTAAHEVRQSFATLEGDRIAWAAWYKSSGRADKVRIGPVGGAVDQHTLSSPNSAWTRNSGVYEVAHAGDTQFAFYGPNTANVGSIDDVELYLECKISVTGSAAIVNDRDPAGTSVGDMVTFTFDITNAADPATGAATLKGLQITAGLSCTKAGQAVTLPMPADTLLKPGETIRCTATRVIGQGDADNGFVARTLTASGQDAAAVSVSHSATARLPIPPAPVLGTEVDCSRGKNLGFEGRIINNVAEYWTRDHGFRVYTDGQTNWGSNYIGTDLAHDRKLNHYRQSFATLEGDRIAWEFQYRKGTRDFVRIGGHSTGVLTGTPGVWKRYHGTYTMPSGGTARLEIQFDGAGNRTSSSFDAFALGLTCRLEIAARVVFDDPGTPGDYDGDGSVGDTARYRFTVRNMGTASLKNLVVSEAGTPLSCVTETGAPTNAGTVLKADDPSTSADDGHRFVCDATHTVDQADVDRGHVVAKTVTVTGDDATGEAAHRPTASVTSEALDTVAATPAMTVTPGAVTPPAGRADKGDTVEFSFTVVNTGNVSLETVAVRGATTVKCDPAVSSSGPLGPDASTECMATLELTQPHLDAGSLAAIATVTPVRGTLSPSSASLGTVTLTAAPAVAFDKAKTAPSGKVAAGGRVSYSFAVTNTGNVTLSEVSVADPKTGKVTCPQTSVAPGKKTTCTATYVATPADIGAGVISNRATVTAKAPDKKTFTATDSVTFDPDTGQVTADRHAGPERYSTAVEISKATFAPGVEAVYVATGVNFPDALAGSAASGGDGPILLVTKDAIPRATLAELRRLKPKKIIVLGGIGVVSQAVESALQKQGATTRQSGSDRYSTAAAISAKHFQPGAAVAFVATGEDFPDALTGGPAAAALGGPILLTQKAKLPSATVSELRRLKPKRIVVVGGTGVVSEAVEKALASYTTGEVSRLAGADRYSTGAAISKDAFKPGVPVAYVATGANFPDALAGGAAGAFRDGPVLLVAKDSIPKATAAELTRLKPRSIIVLGGEAVVPKKIETALGAYLPKTP